jgi:hypothetical protein
MGGKEQYRFIKGALSFVMLDPEPGMKIKPNIERKAS